MSRTIYRAIIIDDESLNIETLDKILEIHCPEVKVVARCKSPLDGIRMVNQLKPEIVFLDISMPELNGFEFLNQFKRIFFHVIFITAHSEYALKAIKYAAFDFILKPIDYMEVVQTIARLKSTDFKQLVSSNSNHKNATTDLALPTLDGLSFIDINEIIYCQSDNSYTSFFLKDGKKIVVSRSLKETTEMLEKHSFFRIHQSYLVNTRCIKKYTKFNSTVVVVNGQELPLAVRKREEFLRFVTRL